MPSPIEHNDAITETANRLRANRAAAIFNTLVAAGYTITRSAEAAMPETYAPCVRITGHDHNGNEFALYVE